MKKTEEVDIKDDPWYYELYPDYSKINVKKMNEATKKLVEGKEKDDGQDVEGHPV